MLICYLTAYIMDIVFGDPYTFPHPVRYIGALINYLETKAVFFDNKKFYGFILCFIVVSSAYIVSLCLSSVSVVIEVILIYTVFATRSLGDEAMKIYRALTQADIGNARYNLGFIVSRDTTVMNERDIIRGTVETVSENISDGIIAPLFYLAIGGLPLAMFYKAASTLDSMIGYKNDKYRDLGFASAKLDDILNFIPARLTGFVIIPLAALFSGKSFIGSLKIVCRDRLHHDSPNSAHGEAAVAGALGVQMGGATVYDGKIENKPLIGDKKRDFAKSDIKDTVILSWLSSIIAFAMVILIVLWRGL